MKKFLMMIFCVMLGNALYNRLPLSLVQFAWWLFTEPVLVSGVCAVLILFGIALFFLVKRIQKLDDAVWSIDQAVAGLLPKKRKRR